MPRTIVLLPVYNEVHGLGEMLARVWKQADAVVCVNDASTDRSLEVMRRFARGRKGFYFVDLPRNKGMAGALKAGFRFVLHLVGRGVFSGDDVLVMMDADGQHEPEYIPAALKHMRNGGFDVILLRRNLAKYPRYKVWGNRFLTALNSLMSGVRYHDVECGYRLMKVKVLPEILRYYKGIDYSCAQEIAFLTVRQGFKVDNTFSIDIPFYRQGATFWDGFTVLGIGVLTVFRWLLGLQVAQEDVSEFCEKNYQDSRKAWK